LIAAGIIWYQQYSKCHHQRQHGIVTIGITDSLVSAWYHHGTTSVDFLKIFDVYASPMGYLLTQKCHFWYVRKNA
jgi:hypothetical protein